MRTNFNFVSENQNITFVKGDTLSFNVEITDNNGQAVTVSSAKFTAKKDTSSETSLFSKSLNNGITQVGNMLFVRIPPTDTESAESGSYYYDFEIGVESDNYTILRGLITLLDTTN